MSNNKKIVSAVLVFGAMLFFSACQENTWPASPQGNDASSQPENQVQNQTEQMPNPTGEVDDILDTISSGAQIEEDEIEQEEKETLLIIDDEEETDDLSRAYDEDEF